jgi:HlyD family secretion protein
MKRLIRLLVRTLMYLAGIAVLGGGLIWSFWPQPLPVEWTAVSRGPLRVTIDEDGKTRIRDRYVVSTPLAGRLLRITLDPGDAVQSGSTLLATIEPNKPDILDARALAQAEARVQAAEAAWNRVEPAVERARIEWEHAESELARIRKLAAKASVSKQELDAAEMIYRTREQDLRSARLAQDIARFELDLAKAALLQATPSGSESEEFRRFDIRSPITGQVLRVLQKSETVVQTGAELLELGDLADLEVEVDVLSADAVKIARGTKAFLEQWGGDRPLPATVRLVEPAAFTKISALGVEEQRVNVILDLDEPPEERPLLGHAFRVEARIVIWDENDVLQVPTGALFRQRNDWAVFLIEEDRAVLRTVEVGRRNSLAAQITAGLQESDRVIMHPSDQITDGIQILPRNLSGE